MSYDIEIYKSNLFRCSEIVDNTGKLIINLYRCNFLHLKKISATKKSNLLFPGVKIKKSRLFEQRKNGYGLFSVQTVIFVK